MAIRINPQNWNHLATTFQSIDSNNSISNYILFKIEPEIFQQFVRDFRNYISDPFFNGGKGKLKAIYDDGAVFRSTATRRLFVKLSFIFRYSLQPPMTDKPLIFTNTNASLLIDTDEIRIDDIITVSPVYAYVKFTPYEAYADLCDLDKEVDIHLFFRWDTKAYVGSSQPALKIKIVQEKVPNIVQTDSNYADLQWIHLGGCRFVNDMIRLNAFQFEGERVKEFLKSFPEGKSKTRINAGLGIRVGNVYTQSKSILTGLEMKMINSISYGKKVLILSLQKLMQLNPEYVGKHVHTYYRWIGECLELRILILPVHDLLSGSQSDFTNLNLHGLQIRD
ncbi:unnamed protein product [Amaranthus hypochondriacus]